MTRGILLVSHVKEIGEGLEKLLREVAGDVPITVAAGTNEGKSEPPSTRSRPPLMKMMPKKSWPFTIWVLPK